MFFMNTFTIFFILIVLNHLQQPSAQSPREPFCISNKKQYFNSYIEIQTQKNYRGRRPELEDYFLGILIHEKFNFLVIFNLPQCGRSVSCCTVHTKRKENSTSSFPCLLGGEDRKERRYRKLICN